jgi:hypothetical protein
MVTRKALPAGHCYKAIKDKRANHYQESKGGSDQGHAAGGEIISTKYYDIQQDRKGSHRP